MEDGRCIFLVEVHYALYSGVFVQLRADEVAASVGIYILCLP